MTAAFISLACLLALGACVSPPRIADTDTRPPASTRGPNWDEIDKTVQRVKAREQKKVQAIETERTVEAGFFAMTDEEYAAALDLARSEVRKANPKMSESDVEAEATKRADDARRRQESSFTRRASSAYEFKWP